ncbi:MAG TPA: MBL fold metallo-hydrolase [Gemmatimonadaceae bacterium]|nr:MBL fold metallo-hydrolase [Gemmatimonadaceae bacterium]
MHLVRVGDIIRIRLSSARSRVAGYGVSAWFADGVLIDTGFPGVAADVGRALDELRPRAVVLTHWHEDHAGNAELVAARGIPLAAAAATVATLRDLPETGVYRRVVWGRHEPLRTPTVAAELPGLELIPTPGHSADHHVVWDAARERVFAGDLFLGVKVRALHRSEDPRAQARSLRQVAALRPRLLLDAHRGPMAVPIPALLAKADWIEATIGQIEVLISAGWDDAAIARRVLGRADAVTVVSFGDLSRVNFVRAVRRTATPDRAATE